MSRRPALIGATVLVASVAGAMTMTSAAAAEPSETEGPRIVKEIPVVDIETPITDIEFPVEDIETETVTGDETTIVLSSDVLFDVDSATLTDSAKDHLKTIAEKLKGVTGTIEIDGYTDSSGDAEYNQKLSEKRAQAVVDELKKQLPGANFAAAGHGEDDPVEPNQSDGKDDPDAMAKNRRVEIAYS